MEIIKVSRVGLEGIVEGRPRARSEDKYRRVYRKLINHHAYRTRPYLTEPSLPNFTAEAV